MNKCKNVFFFFFFTFEDSVSPGLFLEAISADCDVRDCRFVLRIVPRNVPLWGSKTRISSTGVGDGGDGQPTVSDSTLVMFA
jgi:hypothetical protein